VLYFLVWAPSDESLIGHNTAVEAAKEASWKLPPERYGQSTISCIPKRIGQDIKPSWTGNMNLDWSVVSPNSDSGGPAHQAKDMPIGKKSFQNLPLLLTILCGSQLQTLIETNSAGKHAAHYTHSALHPQPFNYQLITLSRAHMRNASGLLNHQRRSHAHAAPLCVPPPILSGNAHTYYNLVSITGYTPICAH
jgi:hypothetical protein